MRSPNTYITAEKKSGNAHPGDRLMNPVRSVIASSPIDFGRIAQHVREGEGRKEGKG